MFVEGSVKSLRLENFQTFRKAMFSFCPTLNFIAGPNGSGKSSIANAMALVFGGSPRTIGKTKVVGEYVRFGEQEAAIEAVVWMDGRDVSLQRLIGRDSHSRYMVDGRQVRKTEYDAFVGRLQTNVDNLCQFLPQERVSEFARLSPEDLLIETLHAVDVDATDDLKVLEGLERECSETRNGVEKNTKQREEMEQMMKTSARDVERIREKEEKEHRIVLMNDKKKWIGYAMDLEEYQKAKGMVKGLQRDVQEKVCEMRETKKKIDSLIESGPSRELEEACKELEGYGLDAVEDLKGIQHDMDMLEVDARSVEGRREKRLAGILDLENEVESINEELGRMRMQEQLVPLDENRMDVLERRLSDLARTRGRIQYESSELKRQMEELEKRKMRFEEVGERRMEMLKRYHADTHRAVCWLRENRHLFRDEIIEPPYIQVGIRDSRFAMEVENFLGFQSLSPFICKNAQDFEEFVQIMKEEKKWGINAVEAVKRDRMGMCRDVVRKHGFDGVVSDFIECRDEVMDYLVMVGHFDSIPVSKKSVDETRIFRETDIKRMAAGGRYVEIRRSRYGSDYVIVDNPLKPKNLFPESVSASEVESIERQLQEWDGKRRENGAVLKKTLEEYEKVEKELQMLYRERNEHNAKIMEIKRRETQIQVLRVSVARKVSEMDRLRDVKDLDDEEKRIAGCREDARRQWRETCRRLDVCLSREEYFEVFRRATKLSREAVDVRKKIEFLQELRDGMERAVNELESRIVEGRKRLWDVKRALEEKKEELGNIERDEEYNAALGMVPNTMEELDEEIVRERTQLAFYDVDVEARRRYEMEEQSLNVLESEIQEQMERMRGIEEQTCEIRNGLVVRIGAAVGKIDRSFGELFGRLECEGRVVFVPEGGVSRWRLNVLVRFRDGEGLEILNSYRQSGGEKSVSTILFLLAVQSCRMCPFRLVDEINQGMDRHNEKRVHDILVGMSEEGAGQLFVITPKIVPDLAYSRTMKVIVLYSGPGVVGMDGYKNRVLGRIY